MGMCIGVCVGAERLSRLLTGGHLSSSQQEPAQYEPRVQTSKSRLVLCSVHMLHCSVSAYTATVMLQPSNKTLFSAAAESDI